MYVPDPKVTFNCENCREEVAAVAGDSLEYALESVQRESCLASDMVAMLRFVVERLTLDMSEGLGGRNVGTSASSPPACSASTSSCCQEVPSCSNL